MSKQINLVMVTESNNNKFYNMVEQGDGTFKAFWGRVGATENVTTYPMSKWDSQYNSKVKKGYKDITEFRKEVKSKNSYQDISDPRLSSLLNSLMKYAKQSVADNYTVSAESVTKAQVDEAQSIIDRLTSMYIKASRDELNRELKTLYTVIPRKMKKVQFHLINDEDDKTSKIRHIIANEQDTLDVMRQQVDMVQDDAEETQTLEQALGLKLSHPTQEEIDEIKKLMGSNATQFRNAYVVDNIKTRKSFDIQKPKSFKPWTKLLWHGSRNENWLNIIKTGLLIRPSNAVHTGSMVGDGVYFADKAQKSIGYTSLKGSYWASGKSNQAFLALYEVNTGMELRVQKHESWMYSLNEKNLKSKGEFDSVFFKGGVDLRNNEYIVYNINQSTIKYIIEIEG